MATRISSSGPLAATGVLWSAKVGETLGFTLNVRDNGGGSSITVEQSADNSSWSTVTSFPYSITSDGLVALSSGVITAKGLYFVPSTGLGYIRFRLSTYVSGYVEIDVTDGSAIRPAPKVSGAYHVSDFGIICDGVTDEAAELNAAIQLVNAYGGGTIRLKPGATLYIGASRIDMASNVFVVGDGSTIKGTSQFFRANAITGGGFKGITFLGVAASGTPLVQNCSQFVIDECVFDGLGFYVSLTGTSNKCRISNSIFRNGFGIQLSGASVTDNIVSGNRLTTTAGFGILLTGGANGNLVEGNRGINTSIELVGVTYQCYNNRIIGNQVEGTGDNGISITGYNNTVVGNVAKGNAFHGICIYGKYNTVTGNICLNNGQAGANYGGITLAGASGGIASLNSVSGNFCDDDQAVPTQSYGVKVNASTYTAWGSGQSITTGTYRQNAGKVYISASAGTTGVTAPTHTTGTVSDGGVSWTYIDSYPNLLNEGWGNELSNNVVNRFGTAATLDATVNRGNKWDGCYTHSASPEGVVTAPVGSICKNTAGGASTTLYVKTSGTGNTGWTAK